jgi:hypothetical protein
MLNFKNQKTAQTLICYLVTFQNGAGAAGGGRKVPP